MTACLDLLSVLTSGLYSTSNCTPLKRSQLFEHEEKISFLTFTDHFLLSLVMFGESYTFLGEFRDETSP